MFDRKLSAIKARLAAWRERFTREGPDPGPSPGEMLECLAVSAAVFAAVSPEAGDWPRQAWAFMAFTAFLAGRSVYLRQVERQRFVDWCAARGEGAVRRPDAPFSRN